MPYSNQDQDDEHWQRLTPAQVFSYCGTIQRSNYKRKWDGVDYLILKGKFQGYRVSEVQKEWWLVPMLNRFEGKLQHELYRALVDQINSLHK